MSRLLFGVLLCFVALLIVGCQAGAAVAPTATATVVPATETPVPSPTPEPATATPEPDVEGFPDGSEPPPATLDVDGQTQEARIGSYCWAQICVDMIGIPTPQEPLVVESPFTATVSFAFPEAPTEVGLAVFPATAEAELDENAQDARWWQPSGVDQQQLTPAMETDVTLDLEPGLYVLHVFAYLENEGDASYGFLVEVQ